jgi:hypothetical protein
MNILDRLDWRVLVGVLCGIAMTLIVQWGALQVWSAAVIR